MTDSDGRSDSDLILSYECYLDKVAFEMLVARPFAMIHY